MLAALARHRAGALGVSALRRHGRASVHSVVARWRPWRDRGLGVLVCQQQTRYGIPVAFTGGLAVARASVCWRYGMPAALACCRSSDLAVPALWQRGHVGVPWRGHVPVLLA